MKLILFHEEKNRPYGWRLTAVFLVGLIGLSIISVNFLFWQSQIMQVVAILARLAFSHIPPILWIGLLLIIALWLAVMVRVWRQ